MNDYLLETNRLHIRPVSIADLQSIFDLLSLPETELYNTADTPETIDQTEILLNLWMLENNRDECVKYVFAVTLKADKHMFGLIGLNLGKTKYRNAEVWFKYQSKFWNMGFATETLQAIINFGFNQLNLHRIEAGCAVENTASWRVLEKAGMQREAHTRQLLPLKSGWADNYGYAILASDGLFY